MRPKHAITALAVTAGLALTGCADDGDTTSTGGTAAAASASAASTAAAQQSFNDADVAFAQDMIPHHRQAIEMAQLVPDRAENPQVTELAAAIEAAQDPEIQTMTGWLTTWGEDVPEGTAMAEDMAGMDHSGHGGGTGMMTAEDMAALEAATGAEFDQMFLAMMIAHHEGAIMMATMEQADGENADAVALATKIVTDQRGEITTMQALRG